MMTICSKVMDIKNIKFKYDLFDNMCYTGIVSNSGVLKLDIINSDTLLCCRRKYYYYYRYG